MVSPGVISDTLLKGLADAGAAWYACYQETHNPTLFAKLRCGQDYEERLAKKRLAKKLGLLIEEGILCGVGETDEDIVDSIEAMRSLDADQVRVMKFIPQPGTPMAKQAEADSLRECLIIALLRLSFPDRLIPASLDVDGLAGLKMRLDAGANVITSLVPPDYGLAGVAHHELDIENANRTRAGIAPVLKAAGLRLAQHTDYRQWIKNRQQAFSLC
jgi:methylornithine synthase